MSYSSQSTTNLSCNCSDYFFICHFKTAILGVGLFTMGIVMILYCEVLLATGLINSQTIEEQFKHVSLVGCVMLGTGGLLLLFSVFFGILNKYRALRQPNRSANVAQRQQNKRQPDEPKQYRVPRYEDVVGNAQYPIVQFSPRQNSTTKLPSYDELINTTQYR